MCLNSKIASLQQQKAEIDAKLLQLENLQVQTEPLMTALSTLCQNYRDNAPEELPQFVEQILAACQVKESALAIAQSAATGDEVAQNFAASAMNLALEKRAAEAFEIQMQEAYAQPDEATLAEKYKTQIFEAGMKRLADSYQQIEKAATEHEAENSPSVDAEVEPTTDKEILKSKGFFPVDNLEDFDISERYEIYRGWDIYYALPNGGIVAIGFHNTEYNQFWAADTEYIQEIDATFPESLGDFKEIVAWTRALIDQIENLEVPGQQAFLEFPDPTTPEKIEEKLVLDEDLKTSPLQSHFAEEDKFTEFVSVSNSVGYIKRRDNGEILAAYLGFSNKLPTGKRAPTMAKSRANKWVDHLTGTFGIAADQAEVRQPKRLTNDNLAQPFAYEVKICGLSIGQIQKLAEEDFSLLPNEIALPKSDAAKNSSTWSITKNGYSLKSGSEEEVKSAFSEECLTLGNGNMAVVLWRETEKIENYVTTDFKFTPAANFDEMSPEFNVAWGQISVRIWLSGASNLRLQRTWRHNLLKHDQIEVVTLPTKEAAAIHAVRRSQGFV